MAELAVISAVAGMVGSGISAAGTLAAGKQAQEAANYEAAQLDIKAKEDQAAAQREAQEYERRKDLALSQIQAKSAASGFSATDPSTLALADEIARYGTMQEQMTMYGGTSRRAGIEAQAAGRRMEGEAARQGAKYGAAATILGGISTMAGKYAAKPGSSGGSYPYG